MLPSEPSLQGLYYGFYLDLEHSINRLPLCKPWIVREHSLRYDVIMYVNALEQFKHRKLCFVVQF